MSPTKILAIAAVAGAVVAGLGCAASPVPVRMGGVEVSSSWVEAAENGASGGPGQAEACLALSRLLWDRDSMEALRYLHRGTALRDAECCRQYLARAEDPSLNQSKRAYARLFLERVLRQGPILTSGGQDVRIELYEQLWLAWRYAEPRSAGKAAQVLESLLELGWKPGVTMPSPSVPHLQERGSGTRVPAAAVRDVQLCAGETAEEPRRWLRVPSTRQVRAIGDWVITEANAWGGGSERLFLGADVLAFLVNERGEPSFRGTRLWVCNLGDTPVYLTSVLLGLGNRELAPGREDLVSIPSDGLLKSAPVTEVPLRVRHPRYLP